MEKDSVRESFCIREEIAVQCQKGNQGDGKQGNPPEEVPSSQKHSSHTTPVFSSYCAVV